MPFACDSEYFIPDIFFNIVGNVALHAITTQGFYELRIDLEDWENNIRYAKYSVFRVEHTKDLYGLTVGGYSGDAGYLNSFLDLISPGQPFSTVKRQTSRNPLVQRSQFIIPFSQLPCKT